MNRVLVTGGAGRIGAAVVRRLLRDRDFEVRVSDQRPAPDWMREGCEVHTGDLREIEQAREATRGCSHVIHLAAIVGGIADFHRLPHTPTEGNNAPYNAVIPAALEHDRQRVGHAPSPAGLREDFNISAADERTVAEIAGIIWEECGEDPEAFALEHLPSFPVDVVRRWPSVEKARRLLGWEAQIDVRTGIRQTVDWLRGHVEAPAQRP